MSTRRPFGRVVTPTKKVISQPSAPVQPTQVGGTVLDDSIPDFYRPDVKTMTPKPLTTRPFGRLHNR